MDTPFSGSDITYGVFFHWAFKKNNVYKTKLVSVRVLNERISEAVLLVTLDILNRMWIKFYYHLDILRATKGAHIEIY